MTPPASILSQYPAAVAAGPWEALVDAGGFSGARIWRSSGWRLKAWPSDDVSAEHLRQTHVWMRQAAALGFVPQPLATSAGDSIVVEGAWTWDVVTWMPGEPLLREPTPARLAAAGRALAALHLAWQTSGRSGPLPVIRRRLDALNRVPPIDGDLIALVHRHRAECLEALAPWQTVEGRLQPCLCDVRADHVLFEAATASGGRQPSEGQDPAIENEDLARHAVSRRADAPRSPSSEAVSGVIDFGSARIDHPAADLARLLGDCLPGDVPGWQPLLDAYHAIRPLTAADHALVAVLVRTEAVVSLSTWIERLRQRPLTPAEQGRLATLLARIQQPGCCPL